MTVFFDQLKAVIDANNYTDDQIKNATKTQVANLLGISESAIRDGVLRGMKRALIKDRELTRHQIFVDGLKDQVVGGSRVWLQQNYPNHKIISNPRDGSVRIVSNYVEPEEE